MAWWLSLWGWWHDAGQGPSYLAHGAVRVCYAKSWEREQEGWECLCRRRALHRNGRTRNKRTKSPEFKFTQWSGNTVTTRSVMIIIVSRIMDGHYMFQGCICIGSLCELKKKSFKVWVPRAAVQSILWFESLISTKQNNTKQVFSACMSYISESSDVGFHLPSK